MFVSYMIYEIKMFFKTRDMLLWLLLFPVALGTLFYLAFANTWEESLFTQLPVAVVCEDKTSYFLDFVEELSAGEDALISPVCTDLETARLELEEERVAGIYDVSDGISVTVKENSIRATILKTIADSFVHAESTIKNIAETSPLRLGAAIKALSESSTAAGEKVLSQKESDPFTGYFYNLVAMVCLFGADAGIHIAVQNQANLSLPAARMECGAMSKEKRVIASYLATCLCSGLCSIISVSYLRFLLGVDFSLSLPLCYLAAAVGANTGVAMGFFVGAIGKFSEKTKYGIATAVSLICCFLSGLMVGEMKGWVEKHIPIINRINPGAIITDSFYLPAVFGDYFGYGLALCKLLLMSLLFIFAGIILLRRKSYEYI